MADRAVVRRDIWVRLHAGINSWRGVVNQGISAGQRRELTLTERDAMSRGFALIFDSHGSVIGLG